MSRAVARARPPADKDEGFVPAQVVAIGTRQPRVTYDDLAACVAAITVHATRKLCRTSLRSWMEVFKKSGHDDARDLHPAAMESGIETYSCNSEIRALSAGTRNNRRSGIRLLATLYRGRLPADPATVPGSINAYWVEVMAAMATATLSPARRSAIKQKRAIGHMPRSQAEAHKIAAEVGADPQSLLRHVWLWRPEMLYDLNNYRYTWPADHHAVTEMPYSLSPLPDRVEAALCPFIRWRRATAPRKLHVELLDGSIHILEREGGWTRQSDQKEWEPPPTERIYREFIENIFGFFVLPKDAMDPKMRGLGIAPNVLRLAHLFIGRNVTAFCDFQKLRNGRFDHYGLKKLRQDWCLIIGSSGAYGRHAQRSLHDDLSDVLKSSAPPPAPDCVGVLEEEVGSPAGVPDTPAAWLEWCDEQLSQIDQWIDVETQGRKGRNKYKQARSAEENLDVLFERRRPMEEVVWPTILWLAQHRPPAYYPLHDRFLHEAKIFTLVGLAAEPLRLENWQGMLWSKHLFKREGKWCLITEPEEFKNRRRLTRAYKSTIETAAQEFFDAWYRIWTEAFGYDPLAKESRNRVSYVHAAWKGEGPGCRPCHGLLRGRLLFLSEVWGVTIGPQAFRHIWATDWLKRHPGDLLTVAGKLNDTLETVTSLYGHLNSADHSARADTANAGVAERAQEHLAAQLRKRIPSK